MKASIFCLPSVGSRAEIEAGMAATRPELYQRMLKELTELVKLADDLGYGDLACYGRRRMAEHSVTSAPPSACNSHYRSRVSRV